MIAVCINGQEREVSDTMTLRDYVDTLDVDIRRIAVAHNGMVVRREELSSVTMAEGDKVEIVRAVGGG